jgi:hypothetical protein
MLTPPLSASAGLSYAAVLLPPLVLILLGVVPVLNFILYTGHGGLGWVLLYLALPYVIFTLGVRIRRCERPRRSRCALQAAAALLLYLVAAYPSAYVAAHRIEAAFGLPAWQDSAMYRVAIFPLGLLFQAPQPDYSHSSP